MKTIVDLVTAIKNYVVNNFEKAPTVLSATLVANSTTVTFSNSAITSAKKYEVFTNRANLNYESINDSYISSNRLDVVFEPQTTNVTVQLVIRE